MWLTLLIFFPLFFFFAFVPYNTVFFFFFLQRIRDTKIFRVDVREKFK